MSKKPEEKKIKKVEKFVSEEAIKALQRPSNFNQLSGEDQWEIDKSLGILDWDGN